MREDISSTKLPPSNPEIPLVMARPLDAGYITVTAQSAPFALSSSSSAAPIYPEFVPALSLPSTGKNAEEIQLEPQCVAKLQEEGYSNGLIHTMVDLKRRVAKQIFILDDSGSMMTCDGNLLVEDASRSFIKCSRWDELQDCASAHARLSGALKLPTSFRLLNGGETRLGVCLKDECNVYQEVQHCLGVIARSFPSAGTPLKQHILDARYEVEAMKPALDASGKSVSIIICTDGVPSDASYEEFLAELRKFQDLPVTVVVRLHTDEKHVVKYYNDLDADLELALDVIDDHRGEALEVAKMNPWLNYGLPFHRLREMGVRNRVMDLLDERPLSEGECKQVCSIIFGEEAMRQAPDASRDWSAFIGHIEALQQDEQRQWDPITESMQPWFDFCGTKSKKRKAKRLSRKGSLFGFLGRA